MEEDIFLVFFSLSSHCSPEIYEIDRVPAVTLYHEVILKREATS
jgi:hypothetical protein